MFKTRASEIPSENLARRMQVRNACGFCTSGKLVKQFRAKRGSPELGSCSSCCPECSCSNLHSEVWLQRTKWWRSSSSPLTVGERTFCCSVEIVQWLQRRRRCALHRNFWSARHRRSLGMTAGHVRPLLDSERGAKFFRRVPTPGRKSQIRSFML